jgi:hypothetical protein
MAPPAPDDLSDPLSREIERSRRYRHAFTLLRVAPEKAPVPHIRAPRSHRVDRPARRRRDPLDELAVELRGCLRTGDVAWSEGAALFVLLPETDANGADAVVDRFRRVARDVAREADVRVASFPEHGVTRHALRAAVAQRPPRSAAFEPDAQRASSDVRRGSLAAEAVD